MVKQDTLLLCSRIRENRQALRNVFSDAFHLLESGDVRQMTMLLRQNLSCVAAVLLDISSWNPEDTQWLDCGENRENLEQVPVIVLAQQDTADVLHRAFGLGAVDVIPVGYDAYAMLRRVQNLVELHLYKKHLETMVREQKMLLQQTSQTMVDALSSIIEYRSAESGQHILRIRNFTRVLLEEVAKCCPEYRLTEEQIAIICSASALHDIGKIAIPDAILMKPGKLTEQEREIMQTHTLTGCRILETLAHMTDGEYLRYAHNICHYHHERWDGGGYPEGLRGEAIPICAQVVSLADVYDALTSSRVYKEAYSVSQAVNMIFRGECGVFSPKLLDCFKHVAHRFAALAEEYADGKVPEQGNFSAEKPQPERQTEDAIERLRGKYISLAHYINGLLMELDLDREVFHLIYNPYPELASLQEPNTLEEIRELLCSRFVHPEDREKMTWFLNEEVGRFLEAGLRRSGYRFRSREEPDQFEITLLRINPQDTGNRVLTVLARKLPKETQGFPAEDRISVPLEGTFRCRNDRYFTLLELSRCRDRLVGYTALEIRERFENRLLELIYPEDREMVRREFTRQLKTGSDVRLEHRILRKDGSVRWVYNQSRLTVGPDGQEEINSFLVDIQNLHREDTQLQEKLQRYEMILAQTENVLFEWDMIRDSIRFSDTWEQLFGYAIPGGDCRWSQQWMNCLYPDDMPLLAERLARLKKGSAYEMTEVRMVTARGRYLWCRFRATAVRDARGNLQKITGIILNIDAEKRAEQALQSRADQDSLTKLLNKDAARRQAEEHFSQYPGNGALLLIDLDDFKQINDHNGHLFGDSVLVTVAREIRGLFRGQDIVARVGGDEFLVVVRGVANQGLLEQRCRQLTQILRNAFLSYQLVLSCSVGIALAPDHGQSYYELFRHADQALYRAKAKGKNGYAVYRPSDAGYLDAGTARKPIDSDTQPGCRIPNL